MIQIKHNLDRGILYGAAEAEKWRSDGTSWLFRNKIPFFIGSIDLEKGSISIYDTTGLWQVYNNGDSGVSQIKLVTIAHPIRERRENAKLAALKDWPEGTGDGFCHVVDLGNPVVKFSFDDLKNKGLMALKVAHFTGLIYLEQKNILNRDLGMRVFLEFKENSPGSHAIETGMTLGAHPALIVDKVVQELYLGLVSVLIKLNDEGRKEQRDALKSFLKYAPPSNLDQHLYEADKDLFDYLAPQE